GRRCNAFRRRTVYGETGSSAARRSVGRSHRAARAAYSSRRPGWHPIPWQGAPRRNGLRQRGFWQAAWHGLLSARVPLRSRPGSPTPRGGLLIYAHILTYTRISSYVKERGLSPPHLATGRRWRPFVGETERRSTG